MTATAVFKDDAAYDYVVVFYSLLFTVGFIANSIVLLVFLGTSALRTTTNLILLSMTVADWLMVMLTKTFGIYANTRRWPNLSRLECDYYAFVTTALGFTSMLHLTALAVERWAAVTMPMRHEVTERLVCVVIGFLWLFSILWAIFPMLGWSAYGPEPGYAACSVTWFTKENYNRTYVICIFVLFFFLPLVIMAYCFTSIYNEVKRIGRKATERWGAASIATRETMEAKKKTAKMAFVMGFCFMLAWTPYAVVSLIATFGSSVVPPIMGTLPALFAKMACCYNPAIYFFMYTRFRRATKRLWVKNVVRPAPEESDRVLSGIHEAPIPTSFPTAHPLQMMHRESSPSETTGKTIQTTQETC